MWFQKKKYSFKNQFSEGSSGAPVSRRAKPHWFQSSLPPSNNVQVQVLQHGRQESVIVQLLYLWLEENHLSVFDLVWLISLTLFSWLPIGYFCSHHFPLLLFFSSSFISSWVLSSHKQKVWSTDSLIYLTQRRIPGRINQTARNLGQKWDLLSINKFSQTRGRWWNNRHLHTKHHFPVWIIRMQIL